jgi:hypothetical protein
MWLLPAVMVPLLVGWVVLQRMMVTRRGELHLQGRRPMMAIVLCTVAASRSSVVCSRLPSGTKH